MTDTKFPIYRKYCIGGKHIGGRYGKLNSDGSSIIVGIALMNQNNFSIKHSIEPTVFNEFYDDGFIDCTRDEFEKAYGRAQFQLSKTNVEQ